MVLIREADLLLALLCLCFKYLLVLILDGLLDFLRLHQHRSCVSKVALLYLLASTLGATLSERHRWLVTKEKVVLLIGVEVGRRRTLLLVAVFCHIWLHHHALATTHAHRTRFCHSLLRLGGPTRYHCRYLLLF